MRDDLMSQNLILKCLGSDESDCTFDGSENSPGFQLQNALTDYLLQMFQFDRIRSESNRIGTVTDRNRCPLYELRIRTTTAHSTQHRRAYFSKSSRVSDPIGRRSAARTILYCTVLTRTNNHAVRLALVEAQAASSGLRRSE